MHSMWDREPKWKSKQGNGEHFHRADLFSRNRFADFALASFAVLK